MGISVSQIMQLAREGIFTEVDRGRYDVARCLEAYIDFKLQGGQSGSSDVIEARKRLYDAQCHKTELETERTRRETIPADEHIADLHALKSIFGAALDGIDNTLANDLAALADRATVQARLTLATNAVRQAAADAIVEYAATVES